MSGQFSTRSIIVVGGAIALALALFAPGACSDRYELESKGSDIPATVNLPAFPNGIYGPASVVPVESVPPPSGVSPVASAAPPGAVRISPPSTTVPSVSPTAVPTSAAAVYPPQTWVTYDCESFKFLFDAEGLPWSYFEHIIQRESHCDPNAYCDRYAPCHSKTDISLGLAQINTLGSLWGEIQTLCGVTQREQLFDPPTQVHCIGQMYRKYGKRPWS